MAPSIDGARCTETGVTLVADTWIDVEIQLSEVCAAGQELNGVTFACNGAGCAFLLDDVIFK